MNGNKFLAPVKCVQKFSRASYSKATLVKQKYEGEPDGDAPLIRHQH